MFTQKFTVRYSEIGPEGYADIAQIMAWFQDVATDHSEAAGYGADVLRALGMGWIVLHWDVQVKTYPKYNQKLCVQTCATGFSAAYGHRSFALKDESGNVMATGDSVWILYDLEKNRFCKVSDEMSARYGCTEKMSAEVLRRWKLQPPTEVEKSEVICVKRSDTDTNQHTNNVSYVKFLTDHLERGGALARVRVTYKKALFLNEQAQLDIGDGCAAITRDGEVCTLFEYQL